MLARSATQSPSSSISPPLKPAMADNEKPPNKRLETAMSSSSPPWERLPNDLWHKIFTHLHHRYLGFASLVCKRFIALSNRTVTIFSVHPSFKPILLLPVPQISAPSALATTTILTLPSLCSPIPSSRQSLQLSDQTHFPKDAMRLLGDRMRKTLKSLSRLDFIVMDEDDLALVAAGFPYLQQFYIESYGNLDHVTDQRILEISTKLNSLGF